MIEGKPSSCEDMRLFRNYKFKLKDSSSNQEFTLQLISFTNVTSYDYETRTLGPVEAIKFTFVIPNTDEVIEFTNHDIDESTLVDLTVE